MAGAGLVAIKRRIRSITNTTKITKAMGLVSTSKYQKIRKKLDTNNNYVDKLEEVIKQVKDNYDEDSIYIKGNKSSKKMYVVLTSDTGLCGGFNWAIVNELISKLKDNKEEYDIIIVGHKGRVIFKKLNIETVAEYVDISDVPTQKEATTIINHAFNMYNNDEIGEVYIVYKKLISALKNEVKIEKLLPLNFENEENRNKEYVNIEAIDEKALGEITTLFLGGKTLNSMLHSKASEHKSRMESMGSATENANDILDKLNLKYNRSRQYSITQEISEIVGGAEALK
ncbi:ATP synthase F1 subunit gamma [Clostridium estertheticum]|uniref:ATP synthase gamma chain n=1 Tax=Clostridium estertheticum subsp. estertheticum TaxID=1552 RepID=A0A1J0GBY2_9CLOT|nr:ATP synthase F1 subunit gamma [Clostridium estertheticum]APC38787.1 ATP synthase F1 subunit gamma [Clostridium estertheticum subsp. estertheticum]MBU3074601.1 ATP synthase F1 subunit gamma [Clostridium estertheticum]MBU3164687.1 ATP synthase F1 subunit gamma [Clostridium estertheticum]MBU3171402.1 ATP synthase F1 subunit gamma [Clostridium estertheticum]MBZ9615353.1 ATP synthase F1 subunit gamma [Clostridium estertheticum subsp. laramiense]